MDKKEGIASLPKDFFRKSEGTIIKEEITHFFMETTTFSDYFRFLNTPHPWILPT